MLEQEPRSSLFESFRPDGLVIKRGNEDDRNLLAIDALVLAGGRVRSYPASRHLVWCFRNSFTVQRKVRATSVAFVVSQSDATEVACTGYW